MTLRQICSPIRGQDNNWAVVPAQDFQGKKGRGGEGGGGGRGEHAEAAGDHQHEPQQQGGSDHLPLVSGGGDAVKAEISPNS